MAWCRQATSHYLKECWVSSMTPNDVTVPHMTSQKPETFVVFHCKDCQNWNKTDFVFFHPNFDVMIARRNGPSTVGFTPSPTRPLFYSLRWRHNDHAGVSNHQPHGCLLNRLFRRKSKKTSKLRVTGLCVGNSPGTGEFPAQMASYAENASIWWRHHVTRMLCRYPHGQL